MDRPWEIWLFDWFSYQDGNATLGRARGKFVAGLGCYWKIYRQAVRLGLDYMALEAEVYSSIGNSMVILVAFDSVAGGLSGPHDDPEFTFGTNPPIPESFRCHLAEGVYVRFKALGDDR